MRPFRQVVILVFATLVSTVYAGAASDQGVPLASIARSAHLEYEWLTAMRAVQLSGPGIVLVIRPGDFLYDVNDRVEVTAVVPRYVSNDIYVSQRLANHITNLARQARIAMDTEAAQAARTARSEAYQLRTETIAQTVQGTIVLPCHASRGCGSSADNRGGLPPQAPVRITLLGVFSSQLPNVLLSRHDLEAGPDGKFQAIVPIGPTTCATHSYVFWRPRRRASHLQARNSWYKSRTRALRSRPRLSLARYGKRRLYASPRDDPRRKRCVDGRVRPAGCGDCDGRSRRGCDPGSEPQLDVLYRLHIDLNSQTRKTWILLHSLHTTYQGDRMLTTLTSMIRDEDGASMVEYGLLVALIAMVALRFHAGARKESEHRVQHRRLVRLKHLGG